jgi:maleate cis-trans isomerase
MPIVKRIEEEIFVQIITNNAANYKATRQLLMEKRKMMFWTPYAGHCIDSKLEYF